MEEGRFSSVMCLVVGKKNAQSDSRVKSLMNLKCADTRLSYSVLKGLWIGLRDFSVPSKLTGSSPLSLTLMRFIFSLFS